MRQRWRGDYAPWLALARVKGLGCVSFKKLVAHFGDPTRALSAAPSELAAIDGLQRDAIDGIVGFSQWAEVDDRSKRIAHRRHHPGALILDAAIRRACA